MEVKRIMAKEAYPLILDVHYARRLAPISYAYGVFEDGVLLGVVTYGQPASRALCVGVCGPDNAHSIIELNRLVLQENRPNLASLLVGRSLRLLGKIRPFCVVSYADTAQANPVTGAKHIGTVYQATNWLYTGQTKTRREFDTGAKHSRHYIQGETGHRQRSSKHRYVTFVGKSGLRDELRYHVYPSYPKPDTNPMWVKTLKSSVKQSTL